MIIHSGRLVCSNTHEAELVRSLMAPTSRAIRTEPGCLSFLISPTAEPLVWTIETAFNDEASFEAHQQNLRTTAWYSATAHMMRDVRITGRL